MEESKLEAEKKEEFLKEFRKLVEKYEYDFSINFEVVKISLQQNADSN